MATLLQDLRYGLRMLAKNPGFTAVAVVTLRLGIGANTAIFRVVNTLLFRPLPYRNSSQLMRVSAYERGNGIEHDVTSHPDFTDWAYQNRSFQQIAAYVHGFYNLSGGHESESGAKGRALRLPFPPLWPRASGRLWRDAFSKT
jgi:hypothetical protein